MEDNSDDEWLEQEILKGLEGEMVEMTRADWDHIRELGMAAYEARMRESRNPPMRTISTEMEQEIARRMSTGSYDSADELLGRAFVALDALDNGDPDFNHWLEQEALKGLEGEDIELTPEEWASVRQEGMALYEAQKNA